MTLRWAVVLLSCLGLVALAGCGGRADDGAASRRDVVAAFYPLQYAVEQIGGDHVKVTGLTKPGVEPHDIELTARATRPRQARRAAAQRSVMTIILTTSENDCQKAVPPSRLSRGDRPARWRSPRP